MKSNTLNGYEKLRTIFGKNLSVDLLAEEIYTCGIKDNAISIQNEMFERDFDVYGVEDEGKIMGYVLREDLSTGTIKDFYRPFFAEDLISESTPLIELLEIFRIRKYLFILERNTVSKIITVSDLQKQPIRMFIFSLISLLEMLLISLIRDTYPDENWKDLLSEERLLKAEDQLNKRLEKNEALTLLDNIQLGDKGTIVRKTPELIQKLGLDSKTKCKEFFKNIESLRNNIAHSQEEIYHDSTELIDIILQIDQVLDLNVAIDN